MTKRKVKPVIYRGEHTPGPWEIRQRPNTGSGCYIEPGIGEVYGAGLTPTRNADLIAAAPEMLTALERALRLIEEALPKFNWGASALDANAITLLNEVPGDVRRAIVKARGQGIGALLSTPRPTAPATFEYTRWRHGGWYVQNVRYPSGAIGCVSRNYPDGKWRVVCDPLGFEKQPTFTTRDDAARAEWELANARESQNEMEA